MNFAFLSALPILTLILSCVETSKASNLTISMMDETESQAAKAFKENSLPKPGIDFAQIDLIFKPTNTYKHDKESIKKIRNQIMTSSFDTTDPQQLDSIGHVFTSILLNKIVPHWYGTPWDFNGYTSIPQQGYIACGYFVSTTLKDAGLHVNRYKLAQQGPKNEAMSIAIDTSLVTTIPESKIKEHLNLLQDGLYFIGLDNHVGYLLKKDLVAYFLHSNYAENKVMIEKVVDSQVFSSTRYRFADITYNRELMKKWLTESEVLVIKD